MSIARSVSHTGLSQGDAANRLSSLSAVNTTNQALLHRSWQYGYDQLGLTNAITATV